MSKPATIQERLRDNSMRTENVKSVAFGMLMREAARYIDLLENQLTDTIVKRLDKAIDSDTFREAMKGQARIDTLESQLAAVRQLCDDAPRRAKEHYRCAYTSKSIEVDQEKMIARVGYAQAIKDIRAAIDGREKP